MKITNGIFLIDSEKKVLLVHPTNHDKDFWSIPKGLSEEGEISYESAVRELMEETNIDVNGLTPIVCNVFLGPKNYTHKRKRLNAHILIVNAPLSKMDLDIKCDSMFTDEKSGIEYPENDIIKWETLSFAKEHIHDTQLFFLKRVEEMVAYYLKK